MRVVWSLVLLGLTLLSTGCGRSALQQSVNEANHRQLERVSNRAFVFMIWDDTPKEWLLISDLSSDGGFLDAKHSMVTFTQGHLSVSSRVQILEEEEISNPLTGALVRAETPAERRAQYDQVGLGIATGRKWLGNSLTTSIHPMATEFRPAGTISYRSREVRLLVAEVYSPREKDPLAIYEYAQVIVGLGKEPGELVLEYVVNLVPNPSAANRILTVYDTFARAPLGILSLAPPERRAAMYGELYQDLHALSDVLRVRSDEVKRADESQ